MKRFVPILLLVVLTASAVWFWKFRVGSTRGGNHPSEAVMQADLQLARVADRRALLDTRLKAAREIPIDLTDAELRRLLAFLARPIDQRTQKDEFMAINEVMNQLRVTGMACGEYATVLCALIREPQTHSVVRDYAIQHAFSWIQDAASSGSPARLEEADRTRLLNCIVAYIEGPKALEETGYGTTLNTLRALHDTCPDEVDELFAVCAPRILRVARGEELSPLSNQVSAIQALPALPDRETTLALTREMAVGLPMGSPVKLASIATLGELGGSDDLSTLTTLAKSDPRLAYAARAAGNKLESRLSRSQ